MLSPDHNLLIAIIGPTAVGKTDISIQLAEQLEGEIISSDSRLFYRGMNIGTAKPDINERKNIPHHLIDIFEPDEVCSLAVFQELATRAIKVVQHRGNLPFLVGGTGQYMHAIIQGWQPPVVSPNPSLRAVLEKISQEIGANELHNQLRILDPQAALQIDERNVRRTIRALEVIFSTGKRFSEQRNKVTPIFNTFTIGLYRPRQELYQRIDSRIEEMIKAGLIEEVQNLLSKGLSPDLPSLSAIGYREIISYLQGSISLDQAITEIKRRTRIFVRRQANWFKMDDPEIHWFIPAEGITSKLIQTIHMWVEEQST